jgi:hypothetical protein
MNEKLFKLELPPGLKKAGTVYETIGRWYDGNLVRFFQDQIQPVGGWRRMVDSAGTNIAALTGIPRGMISSRLDDGSPIIAIGTHSKFYIVAGATLYDDTPAAGFSAGDADGAYSAGGGTYGNSTYGTGLYGFGATSSTFVDATTWQLDTFGQSIVGVETKNKKLWVWAGSAGTDAAQAAGSPATVNAVVVTPERFLFALGAVSTAGGSVNARLVRWPDQESTTSWTPGVGSAAGEFPLTTNGKLMSGRRAKGETLLWTDADIWSARYIGGDFIYRFDQVGDHCGLIAPNACAVIDTKAYWMGKRSFFLYDGFAKVIPCEVSDYVFQDINELQFAKIWAMPVTEYGEIWWFYPSGSSTEIDRYVCYSYRENHWSLGRVVRTAGCASGATTYPVMGDSGGLLWEHEIGNVRDSLVPYVESGPVELGDGDNVVKVLRLIPDEKTLGDVTATFYHQMYPMGSETTSGPHTLTQPTDLRFTARQARVRLSESRQTGWRVGTPRLGVLPGSRR